MIPYVCPKCGGFIQYFQLDVRCRDCGTILFVWDQEKRTYVPSKTEV